MEVDTSKDESLCQVRGCPNCRFVWAMMLREDYPDGQDPFIRVGLCKKHLNKLSKAQRQKHVLGEEGDQTERNANAPGI